MAFSVGGALSKPLFFLVHGELKSRLCNRYIEVYITTINQYTGLTVSSKGVTRCYRI